MNRGSRAGARSSVRLRPGFNEAPIHESGKSETRSDAPSGSQRFNEAPIHESGKSGHCHVLARAQGRFNEAPIHESGKYRMVARQRAARAALQ